MVIVMLMVGSKIKNQFIGKAFRQNKIRLIIIIQYLKITSVHMGLSKLNLIFGHVFLLENVWMESKAIKVKDISQHDSMLLWFNYKFLSPVFVRRENRTSIFHFYSVQTPIICVKKYLYSSLQSSYLDTFHCA